MEFNRKQIIEDFERLVERFGENGSYNRYITVSNTLTLIKELIEENERLRFISAHVCVGDVISQEEMEELRMAHTLQDKHGDPVGERGCCGIQRKCISNTVREFAGYLKEQSFMCDPGNGFSFDAIDVDELNEYAKEFLEKDNG